MKVKRHSNARTTGYALRNHPEINHSVAVVRETIEVNESPDEGRDEAIRMEPEVRSCPMASRSKKSGGNLTRKHKRDQKAIAKDGVGSYVGVSPRNFLREEDEGVVERTTRSK